MSRALIVSVEGYLIFNSLAESSRYIIITIRMMLGNDSDFLSRRRGIEIAKC